MLECNKSVSGLDQLNFNFWTDLIAKYRYIFNLRNAHYSNLLVLLYLRTGTVQYSTGTVQYRYSTVPTQYSKIIQIWFRTDVQVP